MAVKITALPTRYEPLVLTFGEKAKATFISPEEDLPDIKRFFASATSSMQGKLLFLVADSGTGKSTFIHSLEVYLPDIVSGVVRLPAQHELAVGEIPAYLAMTEQKNKLTVFNFDGREAPFFNESEYQTFLGDLNSLLRSRKDLVIVWPLTDVTFADKMIRLLERIGGKSAFGPTPKYRLRGISKERFGAVLEKILQLANWRLEDAAISQTEVETLIGCSASLGAFLDGLQSSIAERFNIGDLGVEFPTLVIAVSSGALGLREIARSLRRADSYYIEASRLLMYTRKSNVAEWWANRATSLTSALPHIIALFNAQLVCISASTVVHAVLQWKNDLLKSFVENVTPNKGNAKKIMSSSELHKFFSGAALDNREYGSAVNTSSV